MRFNLGQREAQWTISTNIYSTPKVHHINQPQPMNQPQLINEPQSKPASSCSASHILTSKVLTFHSFQTDSHAQLNQWVTSTTCIPVLLVRTCNNKDGSLRTYLPGYAKSRCILSVRRVSKNLSQAGSSLKTSTEVAVFTVILNNLINQGRTLYS